MAIKPKSGLTYEDLQSFPEDNLRRELIDAVRPLSARPGGRGFLADHAEARAGPQA